MEQTELDKKIQALEKAKDNAYWERNQLVVALSKIYPSWLELHPLEDKDWEKDWRHIVFIEIPVREDVYGDARNIQRYRVVKRQLSWHIHDSEVKYFQHLELRKGNSWDGHTTEEKYKRLESLTPQKGDGV